MNTPSQKTEPHELDGQFEHLSVSIVADCPPGVVMVSLDRPKKRNAINAKMWREIGAAFRLLGTTGDGTRCVLLNGRGRAFCAGIDTSDPSFGLMDVNNSDSDAEEEGGGGGDGDDDESDGSGSGSGSGGRDVARRALSFRPQILEMQEAISALEVCPVPVVAAVHGWCVGAGVDLITSADVRVCAPSSTFSVREVRLGLAADVGTLQRFPRVVGHGSTVRELCFTGEDFGADVAARIGLVSRKSTSEESLVEEALSICRSIARNSPVAVSGTKLSLNYSRDHTVRDGLEHIATHNASALITEDILSSFVAMSSGGGREAPRFAKLLPHARL